MYANELISFEMNFFENLVLWKEAWYKTKKIKKKCIWMNAISICLNYIMCENDKCQYCKEDIVEWYETI